MPESKPVPKVAPAEQQNPTTSKASDALANLPQEEKRVGEADHLPDDAGTDPLDDLKGITQKDPGQDDENSGEDGEVSDSESEENDKSPDTDENHADDAGLLPDEGDEHDKKSESEGDFDANTQAESEEEEVEEVATIDFKEGNDMVTSMRVLLDKQAADISQQDPKRGERLEEAFQTSESSWIAKANVDANTSVKNKRELFNNSGDVVGDLQPGEFRKDGDPEGDVLNLRDAQAVYWDEVQQLAQSGDEDAQSIVASSKAYMRTDERGGVYVDDELFRSNINVRERLEGPQKPLKVLLDKYVRGADGEAPLIDQFSDAMDSQKRSVRGRLIRPEQQNQREKRHEAYNKCRKVRKMMRDKTDDELVKLALDQQEMVDFSRTHGSDMATMTFRGDLEQARQIAARDIGKADAIINDNFPMEELLKRTLTPLVKSGKFEMRDIKSMVETAKRDGITAVYDQMLDMAENPEYKPFIDAAAGRIFGDKPFTKQELADIEGALAGLTKTEVLMRIKKLIGVGVPNKMTAFIILGALMQEVTQDVTAAEQGARQG